jgi:hypothetical protein
MKGGYELKDYILIVSVIINLILGYWMYKITRPLPQNEELIKSEARVEVLEKELEASEAESDSLDQLSDSLGWMIFVEKKKREKIIKSYDKERGDVIRLDNDSAVRYISSRLSEVAID